jgi:hypothetical protein
MRIEPSEDIPPTRSRNCVAVSNFFMRKPSIAHSDTLLLQFDGTLDLRTNPRENENLQFYLTDKQSSGSTKVTALLLLAWRA